MFFRCSKSVFLLFIFIGVISVQSAFDRLEEEPCEVDGVAGKCVNIHKCLSTFLDLKMGKQPKICSFQEKEPVVCCTDCKLVNDTRKAVVANDGAVFFKSGQKAQDKCIDLLKLLPDTCATRGMSSYKHKHNTKDCTRFIKKEYQENFLGGFTGVAVGGSNAKRNNFTHMALLGYGQDRSSVQWNCGGSLISENFILTAGHCISDTVLGPVRFVALGILKRSDPEDLWHIYDVKKIIPHPEYRSPSKYHDIALLETDKLIKYSKAVFPACLDVQGKFFKDNDEYDEDKTDEDSILDFSKLLLMVEEPVEDQTRAIATGWGKLGKNQQLADHLQEVRLHRFSEKQCLKHFPSHRLLKQGYNASMQMCYGDDEEPKDTCEGDSGGPLQVLSQVAQCLYTVIGVTSYGKTCGYAGDAGMYTRVYHYVPWIESVVWPAGGLLPKSVSEVTGPSESSPTLRNKPYSLMISDSSVSNGIIHNIRERKAHDNRVALFYRSITGLLILWFSSLTF